MFFNKFKLVNLSLCLMMYILYISRNEISFQKNENCYYHEKEYIYLYIFFLIVAIFSLFWSEILVQEI